jgi:hypothetical protein
MRLLFMHISQRYFVQQEVKLSNEKMHQSPAIGQFLSSTHIDCILRSLSCLPKMQLQFSAWSHS